MWGVKNGPSRRGQGVGMSRADEEIEDCARSFLRLVDPGTEDGERLSRAMADTSLLSEEILPRIGATTEIGVVVHPMAANCTGPHNLHKHTYFELVYVFRGSCTQYLEHGSQVMREGSFCLLNTEVRHGIRVESADDIVFNVIITRALLNHVLMGMLPSDSVLMRFFLNSAFSSREESCIRFEPKEGSEARYFIRALLKEYFEERPGYPQAMASLLALLLVELMRNSIYQVEHNEGGDARFASVLAYMRENLGAVTLEDLGQRFGYSPSYLSRMIKKFTGKPFKEVVGEMRLARACELLQWGTESVERIASELGYYDRSHFNRTFKRRYGVSPSEYRESSRR